MSTQSGRGRRPRPGIEFELGALNPKETKAQPPRKGISSRDDLSLTAILTLSALALSMISVFLPWEYPVPDQRWWEKLLSFEVEVGPRLSGIDIGFGKPAAFAAGLAVIAILITALTGLRPKVFSGAACVFSVISGYHVLNAFREVANGELWTIENDEISTIPATSATWETFTAMMQNGYGLALAIVASLIAIGASAELFNVAVGSASVAKAKFREPEVLRLSLRVGCTLTLGMVWVGTWWWATLAFAIVTGVLWLVSGNRFESLSLRTGVVPIISVVGLLSALHSFVYN